MRACQYAACAVRFVMISQKTKYALRALLALARAAPGQPLQISVIAGPETIPKKFLEQILLDLKRAGLVASRRGQYGGYLLQRRSEDITFGQVLHIMEGPPAPLSCLAGDARCADCPRAPACPVLRVFARVGAASADILDKTTLTDVLSGSFAVPSDERQRATSSGI